MFASRSLAIERYKELASITRQLDKKIGTHLAKGKLNGSHGVATQPNDMGHFPKVIWELDGQTPDADFLFKRLLTLVAQIPKTGTHMSGSAIDISVLDLKNR